MEIALVKQFSQILCLIVMLIAVLLIITRASALTVDCPEYCSCINVTSSYRRYSIHLTCKSDHDATVLPHVHSHSITLAEYSSYNLATLGQRNLHYLTNVTVLKLTLCRIEMIMNYTFAKFVSLSSLSLRNNSIQRLTPLVFYGCGSLQILDLAENLLDRLDGVFLYTTTLSRLDLHGNQIDHLTRSTFEGAKNLKYLILSENRIRYFDKGAFQPLPNLVYLVLRDNPLNAYVHFHFASLMLSYLDVSECGALGVPSGLMATLRYLQLRRNNMTSIRRKDFDAVKYLSILILDENGLTNIDHGAFENMAELQQLWINSNKLRSVPSPLPETLQRLLMDGNIIQELTADVFPVNSQLITLSLVRNNITQLPLNAFQRLTRLKHLDLSNNYISIIRSRLFARNSFLQTLSLANNPITHFQSFSFWGLSSLHTLNLAYIPSPARLNHKAFDSMENLFNLDLNSSPSLVMDILSSDMLRSSIRRLRELNLHNSDLTGLPPVFPASHFSSLVLLRLSSSNWHCDDSQKLFALWLRNTSLVPDEDKSSIICFTPHSLYSRMLISLTDSEFASTATFTTPSLSTSSFGNEDKHTNGKEKVWSLYDDSNEDDRIDDDVNTDAYEWNIINENDPLLLELGTAHDKNTNKSLSSLFKSAMISYPEVDLLPYTTISINLLTDSYNRNINEKILRVTMNGVMTTTDLLSASDQSMNHLNRTMMPFVKSEITNNSFTTLLYNRYILIIITIACSFILVILTISVAVLVRRNRGQHSRDEKSTNLAMTSTITTNGLENIKKRRNNSYVEVARHSNNNSQKVLRSKKPTDSVSNIASAQVNVQNGSKANGNNKKHSPCVKTESLLNKKEVNLADGSVRKTSLRHSSSPSSVRPQCKKAVYFECDLVSENDATDKQKNCSDTTGDVKRFNNVENCIINLPNNADDDSNQITWMTMSLIPGRDANHEGPLRVYKWEDF